MQEEQSVCPQPESGAQAEPQITRELTIGEKLVGLDFNPSKDPKVQRAKELCAELADLVHDHARSQMFSPLAISMQEHAMGEILNAQMCAVKVLTFKY